ncbi:hypothetical protein AB0D10_39095 [Kitasatospora sp. NPDC048545]|uniref:hypothetical protein n=1 Tax=Kitasatospora sp. NPDC048545 TaxID=3157208 RepID=UPI0033C43E9A
MTDTPKPTPTPARKSPGGTGPATTHPAGPLLKEYPRPETGIRRPGPGVALVVFYRNGGHSVVTARGNEHVDRPFLARPVTVCEVARGTHVTRMSLQVPAAGGTTFFEVEVDVQWTATDYLKVVDEQVTNVAVRLRAPLTERLRGICAGYPVSAAAEADRSVKAACRNGQWDDLGYDLGLSAELFVRFAVDRKTITHAEEVRDDDHRGTMAEREHVHSLTGEHRSGELLQLRMQKFRVMLDGGEWSQICFMLADNPGEARAFMELLRQEARADKRELLEHTLDLVEKGVIQSAELESQVRELLGTGVYRVEGSFGRPPVRSAPRRGELPAGGHHDDPDDRRDHRTEDRREDRRGERSERYDRTDRTDRGTDGGTDRGDDRRTGRKAPRHDDPDSGPDRDGPADRTRRTGWDDGDRRDAPRSAPRTDRAAGAPDLIQRPYTPSWLDTEPEPPRRAAADARPRRRPSEAFDDWEPGAARDDRAQWSDRDDDRAPGPARAQDRDLDLDRDLDRAQDRDDRYAGGTRNDRVGDAHDDRDDDGHDDRDDHPWSPVRGW